MSGNLIRCQNGHLFSSRRYGTVCPYCNIETATKEKKSVEKSQEEIEDILFLEEENPVCGWIVCVKGPRRGKDYRVMDGKNFVGRADDSTNATKKSCIRGCRIFLCLFRPAVRIPADPHTLVRASWRG